MREKYQRYLCSRKWGLKREAVHIRAEGLCERCKWRDGKAVHHITYERLYNEQLSDLILLCDVCHAYQHGKDHEVDLRKVRREAGEWLKKIEYLKNVIAKKDPSLIVRDGKHSYVNITLGFAELAAMADCNNPDWRVKRGSFK